MTGAEMVNPCRKGLPRVEGSSSCLYRGNEVLDLVVKVEVVSVCRCEDK